MTDAPPLRPRWDWRRPHQWLAFGFGAGLSPWAPGTVGTLVAIPPYLVLQALPPLGYLLVLALMFLVGLWACDKTARELGASDPGAIVWDEILGYLVTMALAPPGWTWIFLGFILFACSTSSSLGPSVPWTDASRAASVSSWTTWSPEAWPGVCCS